MHYSSLLAGNLLLLLSRGDAASYQVQDQFHIVKKTKLDLQEELAGLLLLLLLKSRRCDERRLLPGPCQNEPN